jgi:hypothetical protein
MKNIILKSIMSNHAPIHTQIYAALAQTLVTLLIELNNLTTRQALMA